MGQGGGGMAPPNFDRSVYPTSTRGGGRFSPPNYWFSDLPTALLSNKEARKGTKQTTTCTIVLQQWLSTIILREEKKVHTFKQRLYYHDLLKVSEDSKGTPPQMRFLENIEEKTRQERSNLELFWIRRHCFWMSLAKFSLVLCCANENREDDGWQHILFQFVSSTKYMPWDYPLLEVLMPYTWNSGLYIWNILLT